MLDSLLFSQKEANRLNKRVQTDIDSHLLLFIDFMPDYLIPPNPDAKYQLAVNNLYSVFKDTAWCIRSFLLIFTGSDNPKSAAGRTFPSTVTRNEINKIYSIISDLRTIQAHTTSTATDIMLKNRCERWFSSCISKTKPVTVDDYIQLLVQLKLYADTLVTECNNFIDAVHTSPNIGAIIQRWEDCIIDRYVHSRDAIRRSIYLYYQNSLYSPPLYPTSSAIQNQVDDIIISYYYYDYYQLSEMTRNPMLNPALRSALQAEADQLAQNRTSDLNKKLKLGLADLTDLYPMYVNKETRIKIIDHFFGNDLKDILSARLSDGTAKSMHPDDLVTAMIQETRNKITLTTSQTLTPLMFRINFT